MKGNFEVKMFFEWKKIFLIDELCVNLFDRVLEFEVYLFRVLVLLIFCLMVFDFDI